MQDVVGVIQIVAAPVGAQRMFDILQRQVKKCRQVRNRQLGEFTRETPGIIIPAIITTRLAQSIHHGAPLLVAEGIFEYALELAQDLRYLDVKALDFPVDLHRAEGAVL